MDTGLYIAASGMLAQQVREDQLANDLSNASTPGYKSDSSVQSDFGSMLMANTSNGQTVGQVNTGVQLGAPVTNLTPSTLYSTNQPLDFGVAGQGFFAVRTQQGTRYTRDGQFQENAQGLLVDGQGNPVLSQNGATITVSAQGTVPASSLGVFNVTGVAKQGDNYFTGAAGGRATGTVKQGELEKLRGGPGYDHDQHDQLAADLPGRRERDPDDRLDDAGKLLVGRLAHRRLGMLEGLYSAASGMEAQQQQFDAISNDMANMDTPGYQSTIVGFHDLLYSNGSYGSNVPTGAGSSAQVVGRDQTQGAIQTTNQPLDVALQGDGFFEVRRFDGSIGLTRNGRLQLNDKRQLTNQEGMLVQPPITIPTGVPLDQVTIRPDGTVDAAGKSVGKMSLVNVPAPDGLVADGDSVFSATTASGAAKAAKNVTLQQGALEGSNVDLGDEMAKMESAQQEYAMGSQAVQYQAQMLSIANQIKP